MEDAIRIRRHLQSASGSGAALCRELRASCYDRPDGHIKPPERTQIWIKLGGKGIRAELDLSQQQSPQGSLLAENDLGLLAGRE